MKIHEIIALRKVIESNKSSNYDIVDKFSSRRSLSNFHQWANDKEHQGAYLIANRFGACYWFVLIEWKPKNFYLVLFPEKRSGPLIEIHRLEKTDNGPVLSWAYSPSKRDGKNSQRKRYFTKHFLSDRVVISFPEIHGDVDSFFDEIFSLLEIRLKADCLDNEAPDFRDSFPEGKKVERLHKTRERNFRLAKQAKRKFKATHGRLFCEICKFDFKRAYGTVGDDYIEAHHATPLSSISSPVETKIEDIVLLCSNCHKMIHRRRPWLTVGQVGKLLKRPSQIE